MSEETKVEGAPGGHQTCSAAFSIWEELSNAIRGTEADYTQIGLGKAVFLLAVPMILELIMESTFAVVDIYFVGTLGPSAVATIGLTETYLFLLYSVGTGLAMGVTAVVAEPDRPEGFIFWKPAAFQGGGGLAGSRSWL